jgi:hypothetical protein
MRQRPQINKDSISYNIFHQGISVNTLFTRKRMQSPEIPIRICPHCGHQMRTWTGGDISCTRCENDIVAGEKAKNLRDVCREMGLSME